MTIERISENQIRCTLNKNDLIDRELRISELAYGTEKAKALFRDMMQQASYELGFEADDIPLMIEAIPVSTECLVLVVTKVEDPDELDTRFSRFSSDNSMEDYDFEEDYEESLTDELFNSVPGFDELWSDSKSNSSTQTADFVPLSDAVSPKNILDDIKPQNGRTYPPAPACKIFSFSDLNAVIDLSKQLVSIYHGANTLYKDEERDTYYLILSKGEHSLDEFHKFCNISLEYGKMERTTYAVLAYFEEHYTQIAKAGAVQILAEL